MTDNSTRIVCLIAPLVLGIASHTVHGQIDKRVHTGNTAPGRVHDANPAVGSGGMNLARPAYDLGGRADAIVTGNVSGLGSFHGNSPLLQNNAFRANLGTTDLSSFQRQSVGISDVLSNQSIAPGYFYDTQATIPDITDIRRRLTRPGSSTLRSSAVAPDRAGGVIESRLDLGLRDPLDRRTGIASLDAASQNSQVSARPMSFSPLYYDRAAASSIFGPPRAQPGILEQLAERRAARRELVERVANDLQRTRLQEEIDLRDAGHASALPPATVPPPADSVLPPSIASIRVTGEEAPPAPSGPGRYEEMIGALQKAQSSGQPLLGFKAPDAAGKRDAQPIGETTPPDESKDAPARVDVGRDRGHRSEGLTDKSSEAALNAAAATRWSGASLDDPLESFAGANSDQFTRYMSDGEEALREGRYFDAEKHFHMAGVIDRRNPLPLLARGHALAAAGNYISAVNSLTRGIAIFPQIAVFQIDLPAMVGQSDVFDVRRADLERRLTYREDRDLRFLLGYLELYSGMTDAAQKNLSLAAKGEPEQSIIARFPKLVFGQENIPILTP